MSDAGLSWSDVSGRVGERMRVDVGDGVELTLDAASQITGSGREGGGFRLEFIGPEQPALPQATYRFAAGEDLWDIFIVPIAKVAGGYRYEAVFF
jgi:hypothetical protein